MAPLLDRIASAFSSIGTAMRGDAQSEIVRPTSQANPQNADDFSVRTPDALPGVFSHSAGAATQATAATPLPAWFSELRQEAYAVSVTGRSGSAQDKKVLEGTPDIVAKQRAEADFRDLVPTRVSQAGRNLELVGKDSMILINTDPDSSEVRTAFVAFGRRLENDGTYKAGSVWVPLTADEAKHAQDVLRVHAAASDGVQQAVSLKMVTALSTVLETGNTPAARQ